MAEDVRDPLRNPKDPLHDKLIPEAKVLLSKFGKQAHNHSNEAVLLAAASLLLNAMRSGYATRDRAETRFNEVFGKLKQDLLDHYDGAGNRRNVFPFAQFIEAPLVNFKQDFMANWPAGKKH